MDSRTLYGSDLMSNSTVSRVTNHSSMSTYGEFRVTTPVKLQVMVLVDKSTDTKVVKIVVGSSLSTNVQGIFDEHE